MDIDRLALLEATPAWQWPDDADEVLLEVIRDREITTSDRQLATGLAGDMVVINDDIANTLPGVLQDGTEPDDLRCRAAIALGPVLETADAEILDDPEAVPISMQTYRRIVDTMHSLYMDAGLPKDVRRRILEGSIRSRQEWHADAVRAAYASSDEDWRLTTVFGMQYVRGFDKQIVESLNSKNPDIVYCAVRAAGDWEVAEAWPFVSSLLTARKTEKDLLLAAIEASASICPEEAPEVLGPLLNHEDEDIAEAAIEAIAMAEGPLFNDEDDEGGTMNLYPNARNR